jgi:low temperature requirement A protein (LtrA)
VDGATPPSTEYTLGGLFRYVFLFVLIWWAWSGHTLYSTRFQADDLAQRLLILQQSSLRRSWRLMREMVLSDSNPDDEGEISFTSMISHDLSILPRVGPSRFLHQ